MEKGKLYLSIKLLQYGGRKEKYRQFDCKGSILLLPTLCMSHDNPPETRTGTGILGCLVTRFTIDSSVCPTNAHESYQYDIDLSIHAPVNYRRRDPVNNRFRANRMALQIRVCVLYRFYAFVLPGKEITILMLIVLFSLDLTLSVD